MGWWRMGSTFAPHQAILPANRRRLNLVEIRLSGETERRIFMKSNGLDNLSLPLQRMLASPFGQVRTILLVGWQTLPLDSPSA